MRYWDYENWLCDEGQLLVHFDEKGLADDVVVTDIIDFGPPPFQERLCRLLGW